MTPSLAITRDYNDDATMELAIVKGWMERNGERRRRTGVGAGIR